MSTNLSVNATALHCLDHGQLSCTTASTTLFKHCTVESPFCGTTGMSSTLSRELNRGEEHVRLGLLEHELHDQRVVHISPDQYFYTALAWRCPSPGEDHENLPECHHLHELECRRTARLAPLLSSTQGFRQQRRQERSQDSSALPPAVPPAAVREQPFAQRHPRARP